MGFPGGTVVTTCLAIAEVQEAMRFIWAEHPWEETATNFNIHGWRTYGQRNLWAAVHGVSTEHDTQKSWTRESATHYGVKGDAPTRRDIFILAEKSWYQWLSAQKKRHSSMVLFSLWSRSVNDTFGIRAAFGFLLSFFSSTFLLFYTSLFPGCRPLDLQAHTRVDKVLPMQWLYSAFLYSFIPQDGSQEWPSGAGAPKEALLQGQTGHPPGACLNAALPIKPVLHHRNRGLASSVSNQSPPSDPNNRAIKSAIPFTQPELHTH